MILNHHSTHNTKKNQTLTAHRQGWRQQAKPHARRRTRLQISSPRSIASSLPLLPPAKSSLHLHPRHIEHRNRLRCQLQIHPSIQNSSPTHSNSHDPTLTVAGSISICRELTVCSFGFIAVARDRHAFDDACVEPSQLTSFFYVLLIVPRLTRTRLQELVVYNIERRTLVGARTKHARRQDRRGWRAT